MFDMPKLLRELAVLAPAKVNLHLAVKEKRPDGFHAIESVFLALDWGDTLFFQRQHLENDELLMLRYDASSAYDTGQTEIGQKAELFSIPDNIILRALALFREKTGFSHKLKITVEKRIPLGGGLGGGSSDAAAALLALNKIAGSPLGKDALLEMGAALGSDVPFFLHETPAAFVTGRGEHIEPLDVPLMHLVLVNPGFPSNTARAYRLLDEYRETKEAHTETQRHKEDLNEAHWGAISAGFSSSVPTVPSCSSCLSVKNFYNDFLPVFREREKCVYNKIICKLKELGAVFAGLSGAGSTCFGVFAEKEQARKAADALFGRWDFVCCAGNFIERSDF